MLINALRIFLFFINAQFISPEVVLAWGPGVHTVTALNALSNAEMLLPSIAAIITSFPREFIYGCLSADFFIGKGTGRNSSNPHNWNGGFCFLKGSSDDKEASFSYGFLCHLAADVVAHNFLVPQLIKSHPTTGRVRHIYWEMRADYLMEAVYTSIARRILSMDHAACDELLNNIGKKGAAGLAMKKRIFTNSVYFSEYCHLTKEIFFAVRPDSINRMNGYLTAMVEFSCRMVRDLLTNPDSSSCLNYSPIGKIDIHGSVRFKTFRNFFRSKK